MTWFVDCGDAWTKRPSPSPDSPTIQIRADEDTPPEVRFLSGELEFFSLSGTTPRPDTDTTHTVAVVNFDAEKGIPLFAVHTEADGLTFSDLRPENTPFAPSDEQLGDAQSALGEILFPVYIDDVTSDLSEECSSFVTLHTAQYEGREQSSWTYFRTSAFEHGELAFEEEYGAL